MAFGRPEDRGDAGAVENEPGPNGQFVEARQVVDDVLQQPDLPGFVDALRLAAVLAQVAVVADQELNADMAVVVSGDHHKFIVSERGLRCIKSHQKISGQFESAETAGFYARIKSYIETCRRNGINEIEALLRLGNGKPYSVVDLFAKPDG